MWPFKSYPYPRPGFIRCQVLIGILSDCADREAMATDLLHNGALDRAEFLSEVFDAREQEVEALRELRWMTEADRKQADLEMRKRWAVNRPDIDPIARDPAWRDVPPDATHPFRP